MSEYISVVIAAKSPPPEQFRLCVSSFAALANAGALQIIIVKSGDIPELPLGLAQRFGKFEIVDIPPEGVYAAYNAGCNLAVGAYTLFFGADDIALPGMDTLIDEVLLKDSTYHLVAAPCYMQSRGLARPSNRRTGLIFANWCHQGLFYQTRYLKSHPYDTRYRIQADHKMNIDIVSDRNNRIFIAKDLVAYFCAGGISSTRPDLVFRADFPTIVGAAYGRQWGWLVALKQKLIDLVKGPPEKRFQGAYRR
ncbi:glycosyltransferase [Pelomonas sp. KK5]|uniref:glycosyltransferase n=1 Tax=Pelomonas sp. KK5 TaxID=1855730 RepID=UPI00097C5F60|nr:glycosyltransferase [Pelomonas sp. KK5]